VAKIIFFGNYRMAGKKGGYGIVSLIVLVVLFVVLLPTLRTIFAPVFPEGFQDASCFGKPCPEGKFCQQGACYDNYIPVPSSS